MGLLSVRWEGMEEVTWAMEEVTEVMAPPPWLLLSVRSEVMEPRSGPPRSGLPRLGATQVLSVPLTVLHQQSSEYAESSPKLWRSMLWRNRTSGCIVYRCEEVATKVLLKNRLYTESFVSR